jgi:hypothetical protein
MIAVRYNSSEMWAPLQSELKKTRVDKVWLQNQVEGLTDTCIRAAPVTVRRSEDRKRGKCTSQSIGLGRLRLCDMAIGGSLLWLHWLR